MSLIIDDILQHLHNSEVGTLATNLFRQYLPDDPDACIAVFDTGGPQPDRDLPTKEGTFQVYIRSTNFSTGKAKLDAVRAALHQQRNIQLVPDGNYFFFIYALAEGGHTGRDERGRDTFSINFQCKTR